MRVIRNNDTIQIEITSACMNNCSNCTRLCGHYQKHWFMSLDEFRMAVDSLVGFDGKQGVGMMGGEPLLHPDFAEMAQYAASKLTPEKVGLWSCFPESKAALGPLIADCFGTVFINDHSRGDVIHSPFLVSIEEMADPRDMWYMIEHCWAWASWSASINPNGAYFCELAASMAMLFNDPETAWPVEAGWWLRTPKDYREQMEKWCPKCGGALCGPAPTQGRCSTEIVDDVSPGMLERLKTIGSPKIARGEYVLHDLKPVPENRRMASYKDESYRKRIARRYGLFLLLNEKGFHAPYKRIVGNLG